MRSSIRSWGVRAAFGALTISAVGMLATPCLAEGPPPLEQRVKALKIITGADGYAWADARELGAADGGWNPRDPKHPFVAANLERATLNDRVVDALAAFPEIERLMLSKSAITDEQLARLPLPNLKYLDLSGSKVTDQGIENLWPLKKLEELDLSRTALTDRGLKTLATLTNLRSVNLEETAVSNAGIANLGKLPKLRALYLNKTAIGDASLEHLRNSSFLKNLALHGTRVTDAGMVSLEGLDLTGLYLSATQVSDAGIEAIDRMPDIQELSLDGTRITDASAARIARWKNLTFLGLSGTLISDIGVERLRGLKKLVWLNLEVAQITDGALASLGGMQELESLNVADTPITDVGLAHLKKLVSLRQLNLSGTQISDPRLQAIKDLPHLTSLDVSRTQITALDVFRAMPRNRPSVQRIFAALDEKTEFDFVQQPFSDVIDYLRQRHDIEIQTDHRSLVDAGIDVFDTSITLSVKGITLRQALEKLLDPLKLCFDVRHEVLFIAAKPPGKIEYDFPVAPTGRRLSPKLAEAFMQPTEIDFAEMPLAEAVRHLAGKHHVPIELDPTSLTAAGIGSDVPITRTLRGITLKSALELMCADLELICVAEGEKVVIRTKPQQ